MAGFVPDSLEGLVETVSRFSKGTGLNMALRFLVPEFLDVFADHDHEEVRRWILANYPLVENDLPDQYKNALRNLGSNPELREQYETVVMTYVTPENVLHWLHHPEEWVDDDTSEAQKQELKACAEVIEYTSGGMAWLERQVIQLYRLAGIVPEDVAVDAADD